MLWNYLKVAFRNLLKNKVTGFINIAGLAIGMAVAIIIGLWLKDELTFDRYHQNYDRIGQFYLKQTFNERIGTGQAMSLPWATAVSDIAGSDFDHISLASWNFEHLLQNGDKRVLQNGMFVQAPLPEMLSLEMISGNRLEALNESNTIVLSSVID